MDDWLLWPTRCTASTVRKGEEVECGQPAIAVAIYTGGEVEDHAYPVCMHHSRGRTMMSLPDVILAARASVSTGTQPNTAFATAITTR